MRFLRGAVTATGLRCGLLLAVLATLPIAGCGAPSPAPLRVGILVWPAYEMAFLARSLGAYDGAAIELVEFHSPAETLMAYNGRAVDAMALTTHYAIQLAEQDPSQRVIMVTNISRGADALLARPGIDSLSGLRGKRVGVERSALGAYMLQHALEAAGLGPEDIEIISTDISAGPGAYERGELDAVVTYEPYRTAILRQGALELISSRDLPDGIVDVLMTRESVVESHEAALSTLVEGWLDAIATFESDRRAHAPPLARRENQSEADFLSAFEGIELAGRAQNRAWMGGSPPRLAEQMRADADVLRRAKFLDASMDYALLVDGRFLPPEGEP